MPEPLHEAVQPLYGIVRGTLGVQGAGAVGPRLAILGNSDEHLVSDVIVTVVLLILGIHRLYVGIINTKS